MSRMDADTLVTTADLAALLRQTKNGGRIINEPGSNDPPIHLFFSDGRQATVVNPDGVHGPRQVVWLKTSPSITPERGDVV